MNLITTPATLNEARVAACSRNLKKATRHLVRDLFEGEGKSAFKDLEKEAGVYAFWWQGDQKKLEKTIEEGAYYLKGPHNSAKENADLIPVNFNAEWLERSSRNDNICLYVGKSTNIKQRIMGHLDIMWRISGRTKGTPTGPRAKISITGRCVLVSGESPIL